MTQLIGRNANQLLPEMVHQLQTLGLKRESRNGPVLQLPGVTVVTYTRPWERVVFWPERDANPFFHFMESLWMLAGRNDVAFPTAFNGTFGQFSDDGKTFHGAYGHRWLRHFGFDQVRVIIDRLKANPDDRRCVLGMWDPEVDLGKEGKDFPCNLVVTFQVDFQGAVEMSVFNRSNDAVWGALGANAVHFSVLHEYISLAVGRPQGRYNQVSANMHGYIKTLELLLPLAEFAPPSAMSVRRDPYQTLELCHVPLIGTDVETWRGDLMMFMDEGTRAVGYRDGFFRRVAVPMLSAYQEFKNTDNTARFDAALRHVDEVSAPDWRLAAQQWLQRRQQKATEKAAKAQQEAQE